MLPASPSPALATFPALCILKSEKLSSIQRRGRPIALSTDFMTDDGDQKFATCAVAGERLKAVWHVLPTKVEAHHIKI
jgi:hypothetical protein